jgi:GNAT superfamily N-acetyltransferase
VAVRSPRLGILGWRPGALGAVARMHGEYYAKHWGFGAAFECRVARGLADLVERGDPSRDGFWIAADGPEVIGSVAIDGAGAAREGARLRFFIVDEGRQGERIGARLIDAALAFCDRAGHRRVFLWTFAGLDAARALYERRGFRIVAEHADTQWGTQVMEQKFLRRR